MTTPSHPSDYLSYPAGLLRRLGAIIYDSGLLFGVLFVAAIPVSFIDETLREAHWLEALIRIYYIAVISSYFIWFWVHGGQTLGMRAWKIYAIDLNGDFLNFHQALKRSLAAFVCLLPAGIGLISIPLRKDKCALHDIWSDTRIEYRKPG